MNRTTKNAIAALAVLFAAGDLDFGGGAVAPGLMSLVSKAEARGARGGGPRVARGVGVGGVARRTTRRVIRRGAIIATLPAGCPYGSYYGYSLYHCGGAYYQRSGGGYVIVYF